MEQGDAMPALAELASAANMSVSHFQKLFKSTLGVTPKQYANALQRRRAQQRVSEEVRIVDAAFSSGFESVARFYARAHSMLGMSPSIWRAGGHGMEMDYAIVTTNVGQLLVAATTVGVCMVEFGDTKAELMAKLNEQFPAAKKFQGRTKFLQTVDIIAKLAVGVPATESIPLDIQGTAFQQLVWQALQLVPSGDRISYQALAKCIGRPNSHRAVANACGANTIALLIPCHRAVRADGSEGGYRWGATRKKILLTNELVR